MSSDALTREMLDEFQLRKLVHRYCRADDRGDVAALRLDVGHPVTRSTPRGAPDANDPSFQYFSLLGGDS